jgi:16S rRNA (cytosine1402-N4)-methyltransferase
LHGDCHRSRPFGTGACENPESEIRRAIGIHSRLLRRRGESAESAGFEKVDGFVLDLGVSSMQLDQAERGFSFRFDGPLDMRMDTNSGRTAADIVNFTAEKDLADLIYKYGEERHSRRVAKTIIERRREKKFETTADLANVVRSVCPAQR